LTTGFGWDGISKMKAGKLALPAATGRKKLWLIGASLFATILLNGETASAHTRTHHTSNVATSHHTFAAKRTSHSIAHKVAFGSTHHSIHERLSFAGHRSKIRLAHYYAGRRHIHYAVAHYRHSWLQCVPYAREVSHIDLSGDAFLWWAEASGRYARGTTPVEGAVLNFRSIRRMPLGHVAVVTSVIDSRTVLVTQANWVPGTITNDVTMEDVSDNNDWSEVQVELGDGAKMGAPYPTYGFIYNQPDNGTIIAGNTPAQGNEVAEAPTAIPVATDAPNRNLQ
jgi:surface antigen